ncbi:hypothetical protein EXIGLDRAFT_43203 [Exidia glandulosa HHB12029]|uniref:Uncharacterized protein n=1 Tax=Exidia glandulosa HHB12029 TaxID=1314781 RepID=A0A165IJM8_EXIGL|nr:hypothetical protein EXIGLDRAFT_43203 [Exidia glandulosa HHB12029]
MPSRSSTPMSANGAGAYSRHGSRCLARRATSACLRCLLCATRTRAAAGRGVSDGVRVRCHGALPIPRSRARPPNPAYIANAYSYARTDHTSKSSDVKNPLTRCSIVCAARSTLYAPIPSNTRLSSQLPGERLTCTSLTLLLYCTSTSASDYASSRVVATKSAYEYLTCIAQRHRSRARHTVEAIPCDIVLTNIVPASSQPGSTASISSSTHRRGQTACHWTTGGRGARFSVTGSGCPRTLSLTTTQVDSPNSLSTAGRARLQRHGLAMECRSSVLQARLLSLKQVRNARARIA